MATLKVVFKGGPGSGMHREEGHRGIPGQQGGSLPRNASAAKVEPKTKTERQEEWKKIEEVRLELKKTDARGLAGLKESVMTANTFHGILGDKKYFITGDAVKDEKGGYKVEWRVGHGAGESELGKFGDINEAYAVALADSKGGKVEPKAVESVTKPEEISKPAAAFSTLEELSTAFKKGKATGQKWEVEKLALRGQSQYLKDTVITTMIGDKKYALIPTSSTTYINVKHSRLRDSGKTRYNTNLELQPLTFYEHSNSWGRGNGQYFTIHNASSVGEWRGSDEKMASAKTKIDEMIKKNTGIDSYRWFY